MRLTLDLLLGRPLPDAVADLDAVLRARLVRRDAVAAMVAARSDKGIVGARRAVELADPLAESLPESTVRVVLRQAGLSRSRSTGSSTVTVTGSSESISRFRSTDLRSSTTATGVTGRRGRSTGTALG